MSPIKKKTSQEDQWKQMFDQRRYGIQDQRMGSDMEKREKMPEKSCGRCSHFLENPYDSLGNGQCEGLRWGSDIKKSPVVYVMEGEQPMHTNFMMDSANCKFYEKQEFIDTDATETSDMRYRRIQRQFKGG